MKPSDIIIIMFLIQVYNIIANAFSFDRHGIAGFLIGIGLVNLVAYLRKLQQRRNLNRAGEIVKQYQENQNL